MIIAREMRREEFKPCYPHILFLVILAGLLHLLFACTLALIRGDKANEVIPQRIVNEHSTDVDEASGATNSCRVLMNSVQEALDKACWE